MQAFLLTMRQAGQMGQSFSRLLSYTLGLFILGLTATILFTGFSVEEIVSWSREILGISFISLYLLLMGGGVFAYFTMLREKYSARQMLWLETGLQMANGLTTLALTFTLLGISLGIGGLAEQSLTPETIQQVIRALTAKFALAFMTTVIGLPSAAFLRAAFMITHTCLVTKYEASSKGKEITS